jgi:SAM-dependent methyltransferase
VPDQPPGSTVPAPARDDWEHHWHDYAASAEGNPAQGFRRRLILRLLAENGRPERVLDIGSGTGDFAAVLRQAYPDARLLGLELSATGVELARRKVPDAVFVQRDLLDSGPTPDEYQRWATHAVCSEVLEHVDDPRRLLENSRAYLAPGCRLVVTVPGGPMTAYDRHIGHRRHFRPDDLAALLHAAGFEVDRAIGAGFPVFNLYRLLMRALGDRLIDVAGSRRPSAGARAVMAAFAFLLRLNTRLSLRGWQIVAVARVPGPVGASSRG